ncbi:PP2C family protein-serine/threonine phosphatase [uncultured Cellulomonas sp.]|uniref:PP2C family protein-serine/threonine phosphatase n=1 Tax=uncultured Cellulomonas sp. TaxID=189682 RepID=UPI002617AEE4|nr:PP2C family protein-serine/threonine phosphatase [uncultured Cellulomonas sp.]
MTTLGFAGPRRSQLVRRLPAWLVRAGVSRQTVLTVLLVVASGLVAVGTVVARSWVPPSTMILLMLVAGYLLRLRGTLIVCGLIAAEVLVLHVSGLGRLLPGVALVEAVALASVVQFARRNERLGLRGASGGVMLVDLRDRLEAHGRVPALPAGWRVDHALRSAYGEAFSGDFFVASRAAAGGLLEIVLVDVSGKGQDAGVRSLLLSGAFGGLLGAMPRDRFLAAANDYLLRQDWDEGFATAVHLAVDPATGDYWIAGAGHPPAVQRHAGSGVFEVLETVGGPALGIVANPRFRTHTGRLLPGDLLMLYTDGMVETPGSDLELGIDRLLGVAERVVATGQGGAEALLDGVGTGDSDDRALLLVHRD